MLHLARTNCPSPSISLLLIGIEDSIDATELKNTLEAFDTELRTVNEITIRESMNGVRTAIVRVPLAPGIRLAKAKKIKVGWAQHCRVKELATRQGCAKCSSHGHTAADCTDQETRKCFRCKKVGHLIARCSVSPGTPGQTQIHQNQHTELLLGIGASTTQ